jgi:CRISPR-associated protein Cas1
MEENKPSPAEARLNNPELTSVPRGITPQSAAAKPEGNRQPAPPATEPKQLKIVVHIAPAKSPPIETPKHPGDVAPGSPGVDHSEPSEDRISNPPPIASRQSEVSNDPIPARMLNEFVYCQRLFYYEFVESVFVESADTLRGGAIHQRVDSGSGALPKAKRKAETDKSKAGEKSASAASDNGQGTPPQPSPQSGEGDGESETIHSRSVQMGSERLGVVAKMDLVEVHAGLATGAAPANVATGEAGDLFSALEVCPVDYKAGAPREGEEANELWDTDKMQLGLQALILRDNGYTCNEASSIIAQRSSASACPSLPNWKTGFSKILPKPGGLLPGRFRRR